jgi:hypothetical protein
MIVKRKTPEMETNHVVLYFGGTLVQLQRHTPVLWWNTGTVTTTYSIYVTRILGVLDIGVIYWLGKTKQEIGYFCLLLTPIE